MTPELIAAYKKLRRIQPALPACHALTLARSAVKAAAQPHPKYRVATLRSTMRYEARGGRGRRG